MPVSRSEQAKQQPRKNGKFAETNRGANVPTPASRTTPPPATTEPSSGGAPSANLNKVYRRFSRGHGHTPSVEIEREGNWRKVRQIGRTGSVWVPADSETAAAHARKCFDVADDIIIKNPNDVTGFGTTEFAKTMKQWRYDPLVAEDTMFMYTIARRDGNHTEANKIRDEWIEEIRGHYYVDADD